VRASRYQVLGSHHWNGGGALRPGHRSLAALMSAVLQEDFGISTGGGKTACKNTFENASLSTGILRGAGVKAALLVAHPKGYGRGAMAFGAAGYPVVPMPVPVGRSARLPRGLPAPDSGAPRQLLRPPRARRPGLVSAPTLNGNQRLKKSHQCELGHIRFAPATSSNRHNRVDPSSSCHGEASCQGSICWIRAPRGPSSTSGRARHVCGWSE
jgi:hypothetical protein